MYVTKEEFDKVVRLMEESREMMEKSKFAVLLKDKLALNAEPRNCISEPGDRERVGG
jgi:hypothetical protein